MRKKVAWFSIAIVLLYPLTALASIFGDVRGVVRDPQQHLVNGAKVGFGLVSPGDLLPHRY